MWRMHLIFWYKQMGLFHSRTLFKPPPILKTLLRWEAGSSSIFPLPPKTLKGGSTTTMGRMNFHTLWTAVNKWYFYTVYLDLRIYYLIIFFLPSFYSFKKCSNHLHSKKIIVNFACSMIMNQYFSFKWFT